MNKYFCILFLILISCSPTSHILLYKDKNVLMTPSSTNSIKDFNWAYKSENIFDSLIFRGKKKKELESIISNLTKTPNKEKRMGVPRYAFVLDYNNKKDTLYFYDFNDDNYISIAYLVQNDITLKDTNDELKKYLFKHYKKFITKEYYSLPNSNKENYYFKE